MKVSTKYLLAGVIYLLIPAIQRVLGVFRLLNQRMMDFMDHLAFSIAAKLDIDPSNPKRRWH